jgi:hypothetical protein
MSQSRRFSRIVLTVAAGLLAVAGAVPSGAAVVTSGHASHVVPAPSHPGDWCC